MSPLIDPSLSPDEIADLTIEAFDWGISQVGFYELRHVYTVLDGQPTYRGVNRMQPMLNLFDATVRYATTVNASTLYSGGMFDVSAEPVVVEADAVTDGRYWSIQAEDPRVDWFFMAGSQFTGNDAQRYLIVGPQWRGRLPEGFAGTEIVRAPSDAFVLCVRVAVTTRTPEDLAAARTVVTGVRAAPLSLWTAHGGRVPDLSAQPIVRGDYRSFERMDRIADIGSSMTGVDYLQLLSLVLADPTLTPRPDSVTDRTILRGLEKLGLRGGTGFDPARLDEWQHEAIERGYAHARQLAREAFVKKQVDMNGWKLQSSLFYDQDDLKAVAGANDVAWGTPVPYQSHTIGYLFDDSEGRPLDGRHRYTITFDLTDLPPVTEFWELPVYDEHGYFIDNPIDRYSATSYLAEHGEYRIEDGSLTFLLQADRPADSDRARNWLPVAPDGAFQLAARFYGPQTPLIDGSYRMPAAVRVE